MSRKRRYLNFANNGLIHSNNRPRSQMNFASSNATNMNNKTKIALVTGGSRGLGKEMALRLAEKGIDVIVTYHTREQDALNVIAQVEQKGQRAAALQLDTSHVKSFDSFFNKLEDVLQNKFDTGHFDFLINNAGIGRHALVGQVTEEMFDELMNVHFKGVYFLTQKALNLINDGGSIINVSSGLARFATPGYSAYGSMKAAVETLTRYLAKELGPRRIKVNVIAPGAIETDFSGGMVRDNKEMNKLLSDMTALGRVGVAEDIGGIVAFLCTDDARWINAQRIEASGGMSI